MKVIYLLLIKQDLLILRIIVFRQNKDRIRIFRRQHNTGKFFFSFTLKHLFIICSRIRRTNSFFNAHSRRRLSLSILFLFLQMALTFKKHLKMYSNFVGFSLISFSFHSFSKNSSIDIFQTIVHQNHTKYLFSCFVFLWVDITISVKNNQNLANENTVCIYQHSIFI